MNREISLPTPRGTLKGRLMLPAGAHSLILLTDGQEAGLAADLAAEGYAVLTVALQSPREASAGQHNVSLLSHRLLDVLAVLHRDEAIGALPVALISSGETSPAAIRAAAQRDTQVRTVVCHGGLVDLAGRQYLDLLAAPLLFLAETGDEAAANSFRRAAAHFTIPHRMQLPAPGENTATHVLAWLRKHLPAI